MDQRDFLIALNLIPYIQSRAVFDLLKTFKDPQEIRQLSKKDVMNFPGIGEKTAERIVNFPYEERLEQEKTRTEKEKIKIITSLDPDYPPSLKEIYSPPLVLYFKGNLNEGDEPRIAIVGTRRATEYGKAACAKLSKDLAGYGIAIVSGMARGIDSTAHRAALHAGKRTIAVLGSGLDLIYPPEHRKLYDSISKQGVVISEFPLGTKPDKSNFPIRNRIISGLSLGTIVIEASEKSGALITAKYALEQSRELFAVPGNITSRQSIGTNYLIKQGAKLVQRADDVIQEIKQLHDLPVLSEKSKSKKQQRTGKIELNQKEKEILSVLEFDKPTHIDIVCALTNEKPNEIWQHLLALEIKDVIVQLEGKKFLKKY